MLCKDDDKAFIFTLKNPHGVPPTRFIKREESQYAIRCDSGRGPVFGNNWSNYDIYINGNCNVHDSFTRNDGTRGYKCHPVHKSSLFVDTAGPYDTNKFSVFDYEVFTYN